MWGAPLPPLYDEVDNPIEIRDHRNPTVWPAGAKPVTKKATYDDLYRLTKIRYEYASGDDTWVDPFEAETTGQNPDTRRATPSPHVSFSKRVLEQTYQYDWLGNLVNSGDDAKGFYDRSLGAQSHSGTKPYQLTSATGAVSPRDGNLTLAYDVTGNTTSMAWVRNGACLPSTAVCSQRFAYDWDEVGRLTRARRWDLSSPGVATDPLPLTTPAVDLRYTYDPSDSRVLKTAVDANANELHTVYVFASLELRRATFSGGDFTDTKDTEVAYLFAHGVRLARLHYSENSLPTLTSGKLHVLLELPDHLGSSSIVLDKETGELAERSTYQAYGGADSDYRPDRWGSFREDYRFTGKEEDSEVGLDYFGKRYLAVGLNRWLSADPLAIHAPGQADLNLYAYVLGRPLVARDTVGFDATFTITPTTVTVRANIVVGAAVTPGEYAALKQGADMWNNSSYSHVDAITHAVRSVKFEITLVRENPWEAAKRGSSPTQAGAAPRQNSWDRLAGRPPPPPPPQDRTNRAFTAQAQEVGRTSSGAVGVGKTEQGHIVTVSAIPSDSIAHRFAHEVGHVMGAGDMEHRGFGGLIPDATVHAPIMTGNAGGARPAQVGVTQEDVDKVVVPVVERHDRLIESMKSSGNSQVATELQQRDTLQVQGAEGRH